MEKNNKLKKVGIKIHTCYYFNDITKIEDFDFNNNLLNEKSYENISIYDVSYKTLIGAKPLHIMFDKVDGFTRDYNGTKCLSLFGFGKCNVIFNRIRYSVLFHIMFLIIMQ